MSEAGSGEVRGGKAREPGGAGASGAAPGPEAPGAISRRGALKVIGAGAALGAAAGAAGACAPDGAGRGGGAGAGVDAAHEALSGYEPVPPSNPLAAGTAADPDLLAPVVPWEMVLTDEEMRQVAVLADVIIPADARSPAASEVGVPEYVNEFVSAPGHEESLTALRGGLAWLNRAAGERFGAEEFAALDGEQMRSICDEICFEPDAPAGLKPQARFFDAFRDMVSTGFWTTEEGMRDLGFAGNVPMPSWDGPPPEVLERLGLG